MVLLVLMVFILVLIFPLIAISLFFVDQAMSSTEWHLYTVSENRSTLVHRITNQTCQSPSPLQTAIPATPPAGMSICSKCPGFLYLVPEEFRAHSKSEWHVSNSRRSAGTGLSFEEWSNLDQSDDGESSSSSSAEEHDVCSVAKLILNQIQFRVFPENNVALPSVYASISQLLTAKYFAVLLYRSGRFAGAVWDHSGNVLVHTSFKRYTVRRKNGGSQSKSDKSKGSPAQSVGAQLRRENEKKLAAEVGELVQSTWFKFFSDPNCVVFAYASKSLCDDLFVGPLDKSKTPQCTILKVPMSVRDPTFAEVCRVHRAMTSFAIR
jgi:hypothetical protein